MRFHAIDGIRVMDATKGTSGKGFDAALKALEDLETSVAQAREDKPVPPAAEPAPAVEPAPATVITAVPIVEVEEVPAASGAEAEAVPQQQPNPQPTSQDEPAAEPAAVAAPQPHLCRPPFRSPSRSRRLPPAVRCSAGWRSASAWCRAWSPPLAS
ncbi:hypothetical protein ACFSTI_19130 [Rhizorhabdus histidinilytica]